MKHDFLDNVEDANLRVREVAQEEIYFAIQRSREGEGILTLQDIAMVVSKAVGDDAKTLAGLMYVTNCGEEKPKKINYFDTPNPTPGEKIINAILGGY